MLEIKGIEINAKLYAGCAAGSEIVRAQTKYRKRWREITKLAR